MRKHLLASASILLGALALAMPAKADVFVTEDVTFDKDVVVAQTLVIAKIITITVAGTFEGSSAADPTVVINQANNSNEYSYDSGDLGLRLPADYLAAMSGSVTGNVGISQFNQDVGSMNNQANDLTASISFQAYFAQSLVAVEQYTNENRAATDGTATFGNGHANRVSSMTDSVVGNVGVTQVNQSSGVMNNQVNAVGLGIGSESAVAISDASLGQANVGNMTFDIAVVRSNTIMNSVNGNTGLTMVNQSSGNMNNQGTVISISGSFGF